MEVVYFYRFCWNRRSRSGDVQLGVRTPQTSLVTSLTVINLLIQSFSFLTVPFLPVSILDIWLSWPAVALTRQISHPGTGTTCFRECRMRLSYPIPRNNRPNFRFCVVYMFKNKNSNNFCYIQLHIWWPRTSGGLLTLDYCKYSQQLATHLSNRGQAHSSNGWNKTCSLILIRETEAFLSA